MGEKLPTNSNRNMTKFTLACYKSISYRLFSVVSILVIGYWVTDDWLIAGSIAVFDQVFKTVFYFFHERVWTKIYKTYKTRKK